MSRTFARTACALALSATTGCADFIFSYADDSDLPPFEVKDIGSDCTGEPVDEELARGTIERVGDECVITGELAIQAIKHEDVIGFLEDIAVDHDDFSRGDAEWALGGICWRAADEFDDGDAYEKCDYGPMVDAEWRPVGASDWSDNPELPDGATAEIAVAFHSWPSTVSLDDAANVAPALVYETNGARFPEGDVYFENEFSTPFAEAFDAQLDLWSVLRARFTVPMADLGTFTQNEYRVFFAFQMYEQGAIDEQSLIALWINALFGGGDEEE